MIELKAIYAYTYDEVETLNNRAEGNEYYPKSEADKVIAEKDAKIRKLKRALYKACANWARSERYTEATWHDDEHRELLWASVQAKCLSKTEEYK